ncbi:ABC transporter ATP-binding protein [Halapricum desulfuricans]|uniref:ABC-type oligopeptide transport system, ATPase component n=1 Tax=Halapricum desulfuricans TaxID=2841257 RepID=A0A897MYU1_9EURY|nr:oligopeptide/dipeptide ABC transporter ATP-binding protein [Halapricum desulfuricans]QSG05451.1 ABC-type oligopeptide transport system, ATPase component [Halapricum desulfuricans]
MTEPLLSVVDLKKHYPLKRGLFNRTVGAVKAVDGISFDLYPGETLGLVGESGCGKSTAATSILQLEEPTDGEVIFNGGGRSRADRNPDGTHPNDVTTFDKRELKRFRRSAQMIFQDPSSSFNPRMSVGSSIAELLLVHGMTDRDQRRAIVEDLLERVNLSADDYDRYPHEFSGGQKQRIALARALVLNPDLIVADEPVSALDVSVQAEILSLIDDLQAEFDLSLLFISHDMSTIREICDRVAVMYLGEIVEIGDAETVFSDPQHPYTEALLSSIPTTDPRTRQEGIELPGTVPSPADPPSGCRFHTRCHRVVQPDHLELDQDVWRRLLTFRKRVEEGAIDLEKVRESIQTTDDASDPQALKAEIREEFDIPQQIGDQTARETVSEALEELVAGRQVSAAELLSETFSTPCEETRPEFTDHGSGHRSACIRHRESIEPPAISADDD